MAKRRSMDMTVLVVGASGATGRLLVQQLLERGERVRVVVRSRELFLDMISNQENLSIFQGSIIELGDEELVHIVQGCNAIVSCLGHNLSFRGIFGKPQRLVTESTRRLCEAVQSSRPAEHVKFVLMNTAGNSNRDLDEGVSMGQKCIVWLIRHLLPPHADNEQAAEYLRTRLGQDDEYIQWSVVRPDGLLDEQQVSDYTVHVSPIRSAIFDAGVTSRINVGHFMTELLANESSWNLWKGKMPVIYNLEQTASISPE